GRAAGLADQAAAGAGFADTDEARQARRDPGWRTASDRDIRDHEASTTAVAELLTDPELDVPLDPPADVAGTKVAVEAARKQHDDAVGARDRAQHKAEQLAGLAPQLAARLHELEPLADRAEQARRLADLAAGGGANTLRMTLSSFVLAARLEEVAAAASERLLKMTSGRYSLVHTDARRGAGRSGLGLLACDTWTGIPARCPAARRSWPAWPWPSAWPTSSPPRRAAPGSRRCSSTRASAAWTRTPWKR